MEIQSYPQNVFHFFMNGIDIKSDSAMILYRRNVPGLPVVLWPSQTWNLIHVAQASACGV